MNNSEYDKCGSLGGILMLCRVEYVIYVNDVKHTVCVHGYLEIENEAHIMEEPEPREWCPVCEPEIDQIISYVVERRCSRHPALSDEWAAPLESHDAGGVSNKMWCDFIHRNKQ
jgi:hypothetical protein